MQRRLQKDPSVCSLTVTLPSGAAAFFTSCGFLFGGGLLSLSTAHKSSSAPTRREEERSVGGSLSGLETFGEKRSGAQNAAGTGWVVFHDSTFCSAWDIRVSTALAPPFHKTTPDPLERKGWEAAREPQMDNRTAGVECVLQADFQYSLFTVLYSVVFVLGLLENGVALYMLACRAVAAPRAQVYLLNLATVDTLFLCVLPFKIHYHLHRNHWVFGDLACRLTGSMYFLNIYLSIAFFTCICMDRYLAVLHPFAYARVKSSHYTLVAAALWLAAVSIVTPLMLGGPLHSSTKNATVCFENFSPASWTGRMMPYNVCALVFGFVIPFTVILISYPLIARRISQIPRSAHKRKALGTICLILLICTTCFLPFHLTHLLHFLMRAGVIQNCLFAGSIYQLRRVTLALVSLNCCLNPILYCFTATGRGRWRLPRRARPSKVYTICGGSEHRHGPFPPQSKAEGKPGQQKRRVPDEVNLLKLPRPFGGL